MSAELKMEAEEEASTRGAGRAEGSSLWDGKWVQQYQTAGCVPKFLAWQGRPGSHNHFTDQVTSNQRHECWAGDCVPKTAQSPWTIADTSEERIILQRTTSDKEKHFEQETEELLTCFNKQISVNRELSSELLAERDDRLTRKINMCKEICECITHKCICHGTPETGQSFLTRDRPPLMHQPLKSRRRGKFMKIFWKIWKRICRL